MSAKCIKCGSQKTHGSRVRTGERTAAMLFLKPVRCQECRERFWVQNPTAYLAAGAVLSFIALLIATAWLVIEQNSVDQYIVPASDAQLKQDATGSRIITWPANFKKAGGTLVLSTQPGAVDIIQMAWDGTNWNEVSRSLGIS